MKVGSGSLSESFSPRAACLGSLDETSRSRKIGNQAVDAGRQG